MSMATHITPEVLRWARNTAGVHEDEVAEKLKLKSVSAQTIIQWETGEGSPTYAQLEKLAEIYRRPIAVFFFPSPPKELELKERFRSLPETYTEKIPTKIRFLIRDGLFRQISLYELLGENNPAERKIFKDINVDAHTSAEDLASRVRTYIGVSLEEQMQCANSDNALRLWRNALEECGLWIFKDAFKHNDYCGFCLHDDQFPIIYLNNSMSKTRQSFTLFHELAHLLKGKGGVDMRTAPELTGHWQQEEVFCNAFAGAFLVPDYSFHEYAKEKPNDEKIKVLAEKYKVSREVILRKFYDNKLISKKEYEKKLKEWKKDFTHKTQSKGGDYYATQISYLGQKYLMTAFQQYYRQKINAWELADYLGDKVESLEEYESYVLKEVRR